MDAAAKVRGGITKRTLAGSATDPAGRKKDGKPVTRSGTRLKAEMMRQLSSGDVNIRGNNRLPTRSELPEDIIITGWTNCTSAAGQDSIVPALIAWLERKATMKWKKDTDAVRVKKYTVEDEALIVTIAAAHASTVLKLNGFKYAGTTLKFERPSKDAAEDMSTNEVLSTINNFLSRRYNADSKYLDLSALGQDENANVRTMLTVASRAKKFFNGLMAILEARFETPAQRHEAIQSVSLANNNLPNLSIVTTLSVTLPQLKNLDLSNNNFSKIEDIEAWRTRFSKLDQLLISSNPIEQAEPELMKTITSWFPRLRRLNNIQVRTDEEAANALRVVNMPFPVKSAVFQDESQIAENFVRTFFTGYDTNRTALAQMYYDAQSDFSFSINTGAPRDPNASERPGPQEWEAYIKASRNLKKLTHLPARQTRLYKGVESVIQSWTHLPATRHPDLTADAKKWLIECQLQPGLPDPTNNAPGGVDGFLITIHGEFDEMDVSTGQAKKHRSFDRTFIIGPGGPNGVRVVNDMLTVRAYGGTQAFEPENLAANIAAPQPQPPAPVSAAAPAPPSITPEVAQQMVIELQKQTAMTATYAKDCLEQVQWNFDRALQAFAAVRANLPPDAFLQVPPPVQG
ncbi:hypothetical protein ANO11243_039000 [Dothideomycetidae sp. 11243]|nr:hypothetical protein ANO11243_039000 [fungal sp. No.11243]